jgi:hypothetical protein
MRDRDPYLDWKGSTTNRRRSERYRPTKGTTAQVEGRSYPMMDISQGGLSINDYGEGTVPEEMVVSLYCPAEGFFVDALKCRKVSGHRVVTYFHFGPTALNRIGLEIMENDPDMEQKLAPFMDLTAVEV